MTRARVCGAAATYRPPRRRRPPVGPRACRLVPPAAHAGARAPAKSARGHADLRRRTATTPSADVGRRARRHRRRSAWSRSPRSTAVPRLCRGLMRGRPASACTDGHVLPDASAEVPQPGWDADMGNCVVGVVGKLPMESQARWAMLWLRGHPRFSHDYEPSSRSEHVTRVAQSTPRSTPGGTP